MTQSLLRFEWRIPSAFRGRNFWPTDYVSPGGMPNFIWNTSSYYDQSISYRCCACKDFLNSWCDIVNWQGRTLIGVQSKSMHMWYYKVDLFSQVLFRLESYPKWLQCIIEEYFSTALHRAIVHLSGSAVFGVSPAKTLSTLTRYLSSWHMDTVFLFVCMNIVDFPDQILKISSFKFPSMKY